MSIRRLKKGTPKPIQEGYNFSSSNEWLTISNTISLIDWGAEKYQPSTIADLSCGSGDLLGGVRYKFEEYNIGDPYEPNVELTGLNFVDRPGIIFNYVGNYSEMLDELAPVDFFIMSNILEKMEYPSEILARARDLTSYLVLCTPDSYWQDSNPSTYWAWDVNEVRSMLDKAGFSPVVQVYVDFLSDKTQHSTQLWLLQ